MIEVCPYCQNKEKKIYEEKGFEIKHMICTDCFTLEMRKIDEMEKLIKVKQISYFDNLEGEVTVRVA